ncbi:uncharacterized protein LOC141665083 [Apium graveolens]|uniref:uncharacterized protein LOC141665083 n=1 Tax=Apium graveolens TaxID=4045 RepID=UPI003D7949AB
MLLRGLSCVHGQGYVHCDMKPANVLVFNIPSNECKGVLKYNLKIADFGLAKKGGGISAGAGNYHIRDNYYCTQISLSCPRKLDGRRDRPILDMSICNRGRDKGLVNASASWSSFATDDDGDSSKLVEDCTLDGDTGMARLKLHHSSNIARGGGAELLVANGLHSDIFIRKEYKYRGTLLYSSPESVVFGEHEAAMDIWSLGCIVLEMLLGEGGLWNNYLDVDAQCLTKMNSNYEDDRLKYLLPELDNLRVLAKDFMKKCLTKRVEERWNAEELVTHPFITHKQGLLKKFEAQLSCKRKMQIQASTP